jgi:hypothetical protein
VPRRPALAIVLASLAGCGDFPRLGGGGGDPDARAPDSDPGDVPDAGAPTCETCAVGCDLGAVMFGADQAAQSLCQAGPCPNPADPDYLLGSGAILGVTPQHALALELYKNFGAFAGGPIVPGTFPITGVELDYATCGVCPLIRSAEKIYYATAGTITVGEVFPTFRFTASNLALEEVTIDPTTFESTPVPGGCTTQITSAMFSAPVMQQQ